MEQRLRDRENEFASYFKYGTVYLVRPLISIEKCCSWVVNNYLVGSETLETETGNMI